MRLIFQVVMVIVTVLAMAAAPVTAQSILRDAETEKLFHDMAEPLIKASGLDPNNVSVVLVGDPQVNAFVAGGQAVYLNSGLIDMADSANEVQGVIAHELGHVTGGDVINDAGGKAATNVSLLSLLLGGVAAAFGGAEAGLGVMMAGQQAAMGKYLAFSRAQESKADAAGASYLSGAGISGRGSLAFFKKLQNMEFRYGYTVSPADSWATTHPLTAERIATLRDTYEKDAAWAAPSDAGLEERFRRVKAKLYGYLSDPAETLRTYPLTDSSIPAHYARAYAFHKDAKLTDALNEVGALIQAEPGNPYFQELRGQILLEAGEPDKALDALRRANTMTSNQPLIATTFGHALIATENPANYAEAIKVLRAAVALERDNSFAWYQLGMAYAATGDMPRARLASAEQQVLQGRYAEAMRNAQEAESALPKETPDWLRAQDVAYQAKAMIERQKKKKSK